MGFITETNQEYHEGSNIGGYQYIPIADIINNFIIMFTGEGKVIPKASRTEVQMHAKRAIQEFSYDVFKTYKAQEIEVPPSLTMQLPQDYVNWVQLNWVDQQGTERVMYPLRTTSNPVSILQDSSYEYTYDGQGALLLANESVTWERFKENSVKINSDDSPTNDIDVLADGLDGGRYGLDPEHANANGGFFIDDVTGLIHFSGAVTGSVVTLKYLSDGLGTDGEMVVHKFSEDAIYKYILFAIISVTANAQEYLVRRYRKSFVAARRVAKLRLSNFKAQTMTQIMRGKSKQIKH